MMVDMGSRRSERWLVKDWAGWGRGVDFFWAIEVVGK